MSRWVLVDDTDSGIQYTGSWFQDQGSQNGLGNFGPPYEGTLHGISSNGGFSYTFVGTKVLITGTVQFPAASGSSTSNPSWVCSVDGAAIQNNSYTIAENRLDLCETDSLSDGKHTITVQVTSSDQHTFWLDYVQYFPSASTDLDGVDLGIDSTDTQIEYGAGWVQHSPGQITSQTGSSVSFTFEGVSLTWVGFYDNSLPLSATTATYSVDGGKPVAFDLNGAAAQATGVQYNQVLFQTPQLTSGKHTIQVVYQGNSQTAPLSLAVLEVQGGGGGGTSGSGSGSIGVTTGSTLGPSSGPSSSPNATPTSSAISSAPSAGTTIPPSATPTASSGSPISSGNSSSPGAAQTSPPSLSSTSGSSSKNNNLGAIIGGVVGGLALLVALFVIFLFWRIRRKRVKSRQYVVVDPFHPAPNPMTQTAMGSDGLASSSPTGRFRSISTNRVESPGSPTPTASTNPYSGYVSASNPSNYAASQGVTSPMSPTSGLNSARPNYSKASEAAQSRYTVTNLPSSSQASPVSPADMNTNPSSRVVGPEVSVPLPLRNSKALEAAQERQYNVANAQSQSPPHTDFLYPRVVRDQDSGYRFPQRVENGQMVEVLPPDYTPA